MDKALKNITARKLYRSRDAEIAGVCAGFAEYYELDALVVRILAVLLLMMTAGAAGIAYLVLWANLPLEPERLGPFDIAYEAAEVDGRPISSYYLLPESAHEKELAKMPLRGLSLTARMAIVAALFVLYLLLSLNLAPLIEGTSWWQFWPLFLMIVGLFFLIIPIRSRLVIAWHAAGLVVTVLSISLLPMSLGVLSWLSLPYAFGLFGPIFVVAVVLFILGMWGHNNLVIILGTLFFLLFCILGVVYCVLPGTLEAASIPFQILSTPTIPLLFG